jgi:hypothetical protein
MTKPHEDTIPVRVRVRSKRILDRIAKRRRCNIVDVLDEAIANLPEAKSDDTFSITEAEAWAAYQCIARWARQQRPDDATTDEPFRHPRAPDSSLSGARGLLKPKGGSADD